MARWEDVARQAPELAPLARGYLQAHAHLTLATLRADGAPRVSGTEVQFVDGELWFGAMWGSRKARDLQRDPRFAVHSGSDDPPAWSGDATVSGRVREITDSRTLAALAEARGGGAPEGRYHLFAADVRELTVVRLGEPADHLVIDVWSEGEGVRRHRRR